MKRFVILISLLAVGSLSLACGDYGTGNNANRLANMANNANTNANAVATDSSADIKKLMADLAAALAKNDADAASRYYADDYHLVTPDGVDQTKSERLEDMRSGTTKFDSFSYEDINVRSYGDTAVAISTVKAKGIINGKPRTSDMRATLVFRKMADGWKVVSGQATPITGAATPPANKAVSNSNKSSTANKNAANTTNKNAANTANKNANANK